VAAGSVERGCELEDGAVVGRIRGEHLPELGRSRVRVLTHVERVEAGLHRRRLIVGGGFGRAAGERKDQGDGQRRSRTHFICSRAIAAERASW